jgi:hypothetical protein
MRASAALNNYITLYVTLPVVWLSAMVISRDKRCFIDNIIHCSSGARLSLFQIAPRSQTSRDFGEMDWSCAQLMWNGEI